MMRITLLPLAVLAAVLVSPARAQAPADGVYVTHCLQQATCSATIERKGGNVWAFDWTATDRTGRHTYCRYQATLRLGDAAYRDETMYGVLHGRLPGTRTEIVVAAMPGDRAWMASEDELCRQAKVPGRGTMVLNGIYDLEVGDY